LSCCCSAETRELAARQLLSFCRRHPDACSAAQQLYLGSMHIAEAVESFAELHEVLSAPAPPSLLELEFEAEMMNQNQMQQQQPIVIAQ
jgi:hypothetical protein